MPLPCPPHTLPPPCPAGHYYDYWLDERCRWDRHRRAYYLQGDKRAFVPASSLLLVNFQLHECPEVTPWRRAACPPSLPC